LGLISTRTGAMEAREDLLRRIDEASRIVPLEQLALSPQCGFASTQVGNPLTPDDQWRKLELVASLAREVWP
ncbi:MAG TPA: 5-methyltetrahydropteroyltriglutamate--homocysteine S-methyltransferase, partial [Candidatus Dormibacteraeota bacterium]